MGAFYISDDNGSDISRCNASHATQAPIVIMGITLGGHLKAFTGIVRSVEHDPKRSPINRWRVTIGV